MKTLILQCMNDLSSLQDTIQKSTPEDRNLAVVFGNQYFPPLSKHDICSMIDGMKIKLENIVDIADEVDSSKSIRRIIEEIPALKNSVTAAFTANNQNGYNSIYSLMAGLSGINMVIDSLVGWGMPSKDMVPKAMARKLRALNVRIETIEPDIAGLEQKIRTINGAAEAADSLPIDMSELKKAREEMAQILEEVRQAKNDIKVFEVISGETADKIHEKNNIAQALLDKIDDAFQITTTAGLAGAFQERAIELKKSMNYWVVYLAIALVTGLVIAHANITGLNEAINNGKSLGIMVNIVISILSVGGAIWFGWIATKQIGQRFRLAEDYAYKASVAKAYEGYRQEAVRIDGIFEARLFASTLTRLEEAPLRLVEDEVHGSPWHELFSSNGFKKAVETIPEFKNDVMELLKKRKPAEAVGEIANDA